MMVALDPNSAAAAAFYDKHYVGAEPIFLKPGMRIRLGDPQHPRHCRFCNKSEPEVTFKDDAHS